MVNISRLEQEKKTLSGPVAWSKEQVMTFVRELDSGKYAALASSFSITGRMLSVEW